MSESESDYDGSTNGFMFNDTFVPETVVELLFSYVAVDRILKLRRVCQVWRNIISRRSFWKLVFEREGLDWKGVPEHIKNRDNAWTILYACVKNRILSSNLIRNPSGHAGFAHWEKVIDGGNRIVIEAPPAGIHQMPGQDDPPDSAFVTSYAWSTIKQTINLRQAGLSTEIMREMIPFQFVCRLKVGLRFDCGGMYCIFMGLLDQNEKALSYTILDDVRRVSEWQEVTCFVNVKENSGNTEILNKARYIAVYISGKDNQFWAGHYGPKFADISVSLKCLTSEEAEVVPAQQMGITNRQILDLFHYSGNGIWEKLIPGGRDSILPDRPANNSDSDDEDGPGPVRRFAAQAQQNNQNRCSAV